MKLIKYLPLIMYLSIDSFSLTQNIKIIEENQLGNKTKEIYFNNGDRMETNFYYNNKGISKVIEKIDYYNDGITDRINEYNFKRDSLEKILGILEKSSGKQKFYKTEDDFFPYFLREFIGK